MTTVDITALFDWAAPLILIFARCAGLMVAGPVLGAEMAPMRIRAGVGLFMALLMLPHAEMSPGSAGPGFVWALFLELMVGIIIGWCAKCFLYGVLFGGDLIGRLAGFAAAETFNPATESVGGPIGDLFWTTIIILYLGTNGHHHLIAAVAGSYDMIPMGGLVIGTGLAQASIEASQRVFDIGLALAMPTTLAILTISVAEGVVARAVPQINILVMSFAVKIIVCWILLYLSLPTAIAFFGLVLTGLAEFINHLVPALG